MQSIGILTGGGDCPGLNAVIRAVVKKLSGKRRVLGIQDGFEGLVTGLLRRLTFDDVSGILTRGGTILGTSNRGDPVAAARRAMATYRKVDLQGIVAIGGDGTMEICHELERHGARFVGVPKTIDNDVPATDRTFGFDSAVSVVAHAVDALHTTADAHRRIMVVEVMGRSSGWIALYGGLAGGADVILLPEIPFDLRQVAAAIRKRHRTRRFTIVVIAEGAKPRGGDVVVRAIVRGSRERVRLGGIGERIARVLEERTGAEARVTVLGHLQRGGSPTPSDRVLATRFGCAAAERVLRNEWGSMVALRGAEIESVPIADVAGKRKRVPPNHELIRAALAVGTHLGLDRM